MNGPVSIAFALEEGSANRKSAERRNPYWQFERDSPLATQCGSDPLRLNFLLTGNSTENFAALACSSQLWQQELAVPQSFFA